MEDGDDEPEAGGVSHMFESRSRISYQQTGLQKLYNLRKNGRYGRSKFCVINLCVDIRDCQVTVSDIQTNASSSGT